MGVRGKGRRLSPLAPLSTVEASGVSRAFPGKEISVHKG
jgi:hypothetical protein